MSRFGYVLRRMVLPGGCSRVARVLSVRRTRDAHCIYIPSVDSSFLSSASPCLQRHTLTTGSPTPLPHRDKEKGREDGEG
jgi:hypothetical protein